ncbi:unnamed protein product [Symbiodinium microadriaticum]|nr:unnamed protein product [Symbiodinium microadriaticum]CAE7947965.1 unnamed protein product [Symbiodinium sp. KB8]
MNEPTPYSHRFLACEDAAAHGMRQAAHVLICVAHAVQKPMHYAEELMLRTTVLTRHRFTKADRVEPAAEGAQKEGNMKRAQREPSFWATAHPSDPGGQKRVETSRKRTILCGGALLDGTHFVACPERVRVRCHQGWHSSAALPLAADHTFGRLSGLRALPGQDLLLPACALPLRLAPTLPAQDGSVPNVIQRAIHECLQPAQRELPEPGERITVPAALVQRPRNRVRLPPRAPPEPALLRSAQSRPLLPHGSVTPPDGGHGDMAVAPPSMSTAITMLFANFDVPCVVPIQFHVSKTHIQRHPRSIASRQTLARAPSTRLARAAARALGASLLDFSFAGTANVLTAASPCSTRQRQVRCACGSRKANAAQVFWLFDRGTVGVVDETRGLCMLIQAEAARPGGVPVSLAPSTRSGGPDCACAFLSLAPRSPALPCPPGFACPAPPPRRLERLTFERALS